MFTDEYLTNEPNIIDDVIKKRKENFLIVFRLKMKDGAIGCLADENRFGVPLDELMIVLRMLDNNEVSVMASGYFPVSYSLFANVSRLLFVQLNYLKTSVEILLSLDIYFSGAWNNGRVFHHINPKL